MIHRILCDVWLYLTIYPEEADKVAFEIIPCFRGLDFPDDRVMNDFDDINANETVIDQSGIADDTRKRYEDGMKRSGSRLLRFVDLASLVVHSLPLSQSSIIQILYPHRDFIESPLSCTENSGVFRKQL